MITLTLRELLELLSTVSAISGTVTAWFLVFKRMRMRLRAHERILRENILPRLRAIDGDKPTTRELPAYVEEDSGG